MRLGQLVRTMEARMPWDVAQRVLTAHNLPKARGWEGTVKRLTAGEDSHRTAIPGLADAVRGHILGGEKLVRLYEMSPKDIRRLQKRLTSTEVPDSPFRRAYPRLVPEK